MTRGLLTRPSGSGWLGPSAYWHSLLKRNAAWRDGRRCEALRYSKHATGNPRTNRLPHAEHTVRITAALTSLLLTCLACSSTPAPAPSPGADASTPGDAAQEAAPACVEEYKRVPEGPEGVCCGSLVKACIGLTANGVSPCICSKVACVAAPETPPLNVPCCPGGGRVECSGSVDSSDTQCTCGP